jgi:hypothetical protein
VFLDLEFLPDARSGRTSTAGGRHWGFGDLGTATEANSDARARRFGGGRQAWEAPQQGLYCRARDRAESEQSEEDCDGDA